MAAELLIGAASEVVTPDLGCQLAGFDARKGVARKAHDDLHARALVLDDGLVTIALISVEVLAVSVSFAEQVRAAIEARTGIPAANVVIAATHTHCGPVTINHFFNQGQPLDQSYLDRLISGIVSSVEQAFSGRRPRRLRSGMARVDGVGVNRRNADGRPVDPLAGVLLVEELDGTPAALVVNYACHPTVLGPNTLEITADFPYYTIRELSRRLAPDVHILYFNGAEGDVSMGHNSGLSAVGVIAPFRTFEKAEELGVRLAGAVLAGLSGLEYEQPRIRVRTGAAFLPLKKYAPLAEMIARRKAAAAAMRHAEDSGGADEEVLSARQQSLFSRIQEYYALLYEQAGGGEPKLLQAGLTAIRIGGTALLSFPGEAFVAIGLEIRARSGFPRTLFLGLANGYIGYLPAAGADAAAGYEVVASRVTPQAHGILVAAALGLLDSLPD
jgi:neutral ceramidase